MVKTILILAANPKNTTLLRLGEEVREIDNSLQRSKRRDEFVLAQVWATRLIDVRRAMLDYKPSIVHFCGHGNEEVGIAFEDDFGNSTLVEAEALRAFFAFFSNNLECVVLNACYSEVQAKVIASSINYVIGMSREIGDDIAIKFSSAFYDAIGAKESIEFAYGFACNAIQLANSPEYLTPVLKSYKINILTDKEEDIGSNEIKLIQITSLRDGEQIVLPPSETIPIRRLIKGEIVGFRDNDLQQLAPLPVEVAIKTDIWYPQGISRVTNNRTWEIVGSFGGVNHTIKATLKDKNNNEIASTIIMISVIQ